MASSAVFTFYLKPTARMSVKLAVSMARVWPPAVNQFIPEESVNVTMPPLDLQRHLLDLYFIYVHPVFPVVHKSLFWKDYEVTIASVFSLVGPETKFERSHVLQLFE